MSVLNQTYENWELILVNDGSTDDYRKEISPLITWDDRVILMGHDTRMERVISRNDGMKASIGDWICWLDSDDEYENWYLEMVASAIKKSPDCNLFTCGSEIRWSDDSGNLVHTGKREPSAVKQGEEFKSGKVSTGGFVFSKWSFEAVGLLPEATTPYGNENSFSHVANNPNYPRREDGQYPPLGNPWGDDYQYFYMLTRVCQPVAINLYPYIQHVRQ